MDIRLRLRINSCKLSAANTGGVFNRHVFFRQAEQVYPMGLAILTGVLLVDGKHPSAILHLGIPPVHNCMWAAGQILPRMMPDCLWCLTILYFTPLVAWSCDFLGPARGYYVYMQYFSLYLYSLILLLLIDPNTQGDSSPLSPFCRSGLLRLWQVSLLQCERPSATDHHAVKVTVCIGPGSHKRVSPCGFYILLFYISIGYPNIFTDPTDRFISIGYPIGYPLFP